MAAVYYYYTLFRLKYLLLKQTLSIKPQSFEQLDIFFKSELFSESNNKDVGATENNHCHTPVITIRIKTQVTLFRFFLT